MPFGSWPLLVKSRARERQRGEWRNFSLSNGAVFPTFLWTGKRFETSKLPRFTKSGQEPLLAVGVRDLADKHGTGHIESAVDGAGLRSGIVLQDLDHQRGVVGEDDPRLLHAQQAHLALRLAEGAGGVDGDIGIVALADRGNRREGGADLQRNAGEDQLLAAGRLDGGCDPGIVPGID